MTALAPRYALAILLLLAGSAVPIWLHALTDPRFDDCADPGAFFAAHKIGGADRVEPGPPLRKLEGAEGRWPRGSNTPLGIRVARTYDLAPLMASPLHLGFDPKLYLKRTQLRWLDAGGHTLPVHWHESKSHDEAHIEAYTYMQGGQPTRHPMQSSLALAWQQLVRGTRPLTVLIVAAAGRPDGYPSLERDAEAWLVRASQELRAACGD